MSYELYYLVEDCPMCGQKDSPHAWKGARMSSTAWGHDYSCCSEECGKAFLNSPQYKKLERDRIMDQIRGLENQLKRL